MRRNRSSRRRIFSILLAALTALSVFCATAFAEDSEEDKSVVTLEWKNSLSLQSAMIQAKANPDKTYILEICEDAEWDKTALLPINLSLSFRNCCFTILESGILRCYYGADLEDTRVVVRGVLEIDNYAFFCNSAIVLENGGSFEGNADLCVFPMEEEEASEFPIVGMEDNDYTVEEYDWGTFYMLNSRFPSEEDFVYETDPEPEAEDLSEKQADLKRESNELRRFWFRIRHDLGEFFETFGTLLLVVGVAVLSSIKKKKKGGTAPKKAATTERTARPAAERPASLFRRETVSGTYHKSRTAEVSARQQDPRMKTFTKPEAPCIVCDITGEDHFLRDRENRIKQLDEWLKNGLIDKREYRIMKQRYERDQ